MQRYDFLTRFKPKMTKQINIQNRKARYEYELLDKYEAGMVLYGTEIKSIREGKAHISESFCQIKEGQIYIINMRIDEYKFGSFYNHAPRRERKLLLHKREIKKLSRGVNQEGLTIVPLKLYINGRGLAKLQIALAKGKKLYDKRETIKKRESDRRLNQLKRNF